MALQSPGVQVTVIDESVYTSAEAGTTPLIVVATSQNKTNASNTGVAQGTLKANAGKAYRISSQRELVDVFGVPTFRKTATGTPVNGGEQNEYGLQAAYSFLGVSNAAFIVRADIDLNELTASANAPGSEATDGQWWLDTAATTWGIFEWDASAASQGGQKFVNKSPLVLTIDNEDDVTAGSPPSPKAGVGRVGDYAMVAYSGVIRLFYKGAEYGDTNTVSWQLVGSQAWRKFFPVFETQFNAAAGGSITIAAGVGGATSVTVPAGTSAATLAANINGVAIDGVYAVGEGNVLRVYSTGSGDVSVGDDSSGLGYITLGTGTLDPATIFAGIGTQRTFYVPDLQISAHTSVPQWKSVGTTARPTGSVWVKTTDPNAGARWRVKRWKASSKVWEEVASPLYANGQSAISAIDSSRGGLGIPQNTAYIQYNYEEDTGYDGTPQTATFKIFTRKNTGVTQTTSETITTQVAAGSYDLTLVETLAGSSALSTPVTVTVVATGSASDADVIRTAINGAGLTNVDVTVFGGKITISHSTGGEIRIADPDDLFADIGLTTDTTNLYADPSGVYDFIVSNWQPLSDVGYVATNTSPKNEPVDGQLWYSSRIDEIDIMVLDATGGSPTWKGYREVYPLTNTTGPMVSSTRPTEQVDGTDLEDGDLWLSTADLENYPTIYRYNGSTLRWDLIDKTDQTTENGVLFADARYGLSGADGDQAEDIADYYATSGASFVDFDAPDPALYPRGMLLWNTRRSGFNIKKYVVNHIDRDDDNDRMNESMATYAPNRWVTASANQEDGSGSFGRKAQRKVVVEKLKALVDTNQEIREEESRNFNLISCPGYPELLSNLVSLNIDRGTTSFVVGDTPFSLAADTTSLTNWGNNSAAAEDNGEQGLVTADPYAAVFYPSGKSTDNTGSDIVVPPSHMILKTIALSDQVSFPWFAPAGTRRGGITNATSVGYVSRADGEFRTIALNEGQRDAMYEVNMNPITFFNGVGLVNYGQKTLSPNSSALDRINVARLVVYLRSQLNKLAKPFVFEPNDKITRDEIKQAVESLLLELVGQRALYDFAVVCDETNNTPTRIDRNELYVDIAIEPVKAIEFIYIPLRLKNTGEIQGSLNA
jgi:Phage tail sheath C-terminal domain